MRLFLVLILKIIKLIISFVTFLLTQKHSLLGQGFGGQAGRAGGYIYFKPRLIGIFPMHTCNKQLVLSIMIMLGVASSLCAASDAPIQAVSLQQLTTQPQSPAKTMSEATQQAKASEVLMDFGQENGEQFMMMGEFTPKEIDTYPGYKNAFANHALDHLESTNAHDVAAISHLIHTYPDIAGYLAIEVANRKGSIHSDIKKALATSKRPPVLNAQIAFEGAKSSLKWGLAFAAKQAIKNAWDRAFNMSYSFREAQRGVLNLQQRKGLLYQGALKRALKGLGTGIRLLHWNDVLQQGTRPFKDFVGALSRTVPVSIGAGAVVHVALREFDERVGDPLPLPKYDPKSRNIVLYSGLVLKMVVRNFVVPYLINAAVNSAVYHTIG